MEGRVPFRSLWEKIDIAPWGAWGIAGNSLSYFMLDDDGSLLRPSRSGSGFREIPRPGTGTITAVAVCDWGEERRPALVAVSGGNVCFNTWQDDDGWRGWEKPAGDFTAVDVACYSIAQDCFAIFALDDVGLVRCCWYWPKSASWSPWDRVPMPYKRVTAIATDLISMEHGILLVRTEDSVIHYATHQITSSRDWVELDWSDWARVPSASLSLF